MHIRYTVMRLALVSIVSGGSVVAGSAQITAQLYERCGPKAGQGLVLGQVRDIEADTLLMSAQVWTPLQGDIACGAVANHAGAFAMWLDPGSHLLGVSLLGYCLAEPVPVEILAGDTVEVVAKVLRSPSTLHGPTSDPTVVACEKSAAAWRGLQTSEAHGTGPLRSDDFSRAGRAITPHPDIAPLQAPAGRSGHVLAGSVVGSLIGLVGGVAMSFGSDQSGPDFPPRVYAATAAGAVIGGGLAGAFGSRGVSVAGIALGVAVPTMALAAAAPEDAAIVLPVVLIVAPLAATHAEWFFWRRHRSS